MPSSSDSGSGPDKYSESESVLASAASYSEAASEGIPVCFYFSG